MVSKRRQVFWFAIVVVSFWCVWFAIRKTRTDYNSIQESRRNHLKNACDHFPRKIVLKPQSLDNIIAVDKSRLLYCSVPGTGSSIWRKILNDETLAGSAPNKLRMLSTYSQHEIQYRLDHYTKFLFVRNPFERIVSSFRGEFQKNRKTNSLERLKGLIIKRYRKKRPISGSDKEVTFREFVRYLVDERTPKRGLPTGPASELCHPCVINYNIIGKYETLESDSRFVLAKLGIDKRISFSKNDNGSQLTDKYFSSVPDNDIRKLLKVYKADFKLFDYHYYP